ncbi:hypothetical protein GQ651_16685 [Alphaproteobacteria bacterium GH1-50]|uniref:Uncharacterized protein n=1 Tax=Kangsaoukella pontilimi TaxID=2691042 RepID=A0A7C9II66_9RHOB|nr:hypothetical protein [Kangsaoukella pontilimi]MXQ09484.1 hypothetical protein [Kangsaoukella pontilimi]
MRVLVDYIFAACSFAALIVAFGLLAEGALSPVMVGPLVAAFVLLALALRKLRFWWQVRHGRLGLMVPGSRRRLKRARRMTMEREPALSADGTEHLAADHPRRLVAEAIDKLRRSWTKDAPDRALSDDEVRSIYALYMYADPSGDDRQKPRAKYLRDIEDRTRFTGLREKVDAWYAARAAERAAYEAWLKEIGGGSMNHLLANGWGPFLKGQPDADAELWHAIAANPDGIERGGRLKAAFWILAQPQCDKATASDFIRGFVYHKRLDHAVAERDGDTVAAFVRVVRRYNSDFYALHSIASGRFLRSIEGYGDREVIRDIERIEKRRNLPKLPRPKGLLARTGPAPDQGARRYTSAFAFSPDKGLHLRPPRLDYSYAD